ncbi:MAG TPA: YccF domain-containing protein [Thermoleophilaceae bacterium]
MRLLLNVIWFVFAGVWMAIGYAFAALIMFILIITIPFGVAALRIGIFALWPFGKTVVRRADAGPAQRSATSSGSCSPVGGCSSAIWSPAYCCA